MPRVLCQVLHRPDRVTFIWSDGTAWFEPYHLAESERDRLYQLADEAHKLLAGAAGESELAQVGQQLYRAVFRLDAADSSSARDVQPWFAELERQGEVTLEMLGDAPGRIPWNVLSDGQSVWGTRYRLGGGRRVNPLRQTTFLESSSRLVVLDRAVYDLLPDKAVLALLQESLLLASVGADVLQRLRESVPDVVFVVGRVDQDGFWLGPTKCSARDLEGAIAEAEEGNPDPIIVLLAVGSADQRGKWECWLADAVHRLNGLVACEVPLAAVDAAQLAIALAERFLSGGTDLGTALRDVRLATGSVGLALSAFCPPGVRILIGSETGTDEAAGALPLPLPAFPYRPLAPYGGDDRPLFSGRNEETLRLASLLDEGPTRGILLQGGPGVGKTSLLQAGLLPYLEAEAIGYRALCDRTPEEGAPTDEADHPALVLPAGSDLLGQLADALFAFCSQPLIYATPTGATVTVDLPALVAEHVAQSARDSSSTAVHDLSVTTGITETSATSEDESLTARDLWLAVHDDPLALGRFLDDVTRRLPYELVIVIDQAEELVTLVETSAERTRRRQALEALDQLSRSSARCKVVLSIRSETYGQLAAAFAPAVTAVAHNGWRSFSLEELSPEHIVSAILLPTSRDAAPFSEEVPFQKYGFTLDEGLAERIADEALTAARTQAQSVLAIVQALCAHLYERRVLQQRQGLVRAADLKGVGGTPDALAKYVEYKLDRLTLQAPAKKSLRRLIASLYTRQSDGTIALGLVPARSLKENWNTTFPVEQAVTTAAEQAGLFAIESRLVGGKQGLYVSLADEAVAQVARHWDEEKQREAHSKKRVVDTLWIMIPLVLLASALTFAVMRWTSHAAEPEEDRTTTEARGYQRALLSNRGALYRGQLAQAQQALQSGHPLQARQALLNHPGLIGIPKQEPEMRGFEWGYLWRQVNNERFDLEGHRGLVTAVAVAPDGRVAASASVDGTVQLWSLAKGTILATLGDEKDKAPLHAVAFSSDGKTLASAGADKKVRLWDVSGVKDDYVALTQEAKVLAGHDEAVLALAFSSDASLASAGADQKVIVWDVKEGKEKFTLKEHSAKVHALAFSPDGTTLASAGAEPGVHLWDSRAGKKRQTITTAFHSVYAVAFAPDGKALAIGGTQRHGGVEVGVLRLFDVDKGVESKSAPKIQHGMGIFAAQFVADGKMIATAGKDDRVKLWDTGTGAQLGQRVGHLGWIRSLAVSGDGSALITGSYDQSVKVWDGVGSAPKDLLEGHTDWVQALAFAPQEPLLFSGSKDGSVKVWEPATGKLLSTLAGHPGGVTSLALSAKKTTTLAAGCWGDKGEGVVKLWELSGASDGVVKGKELKTLIGHKGGVTCVAYHPTKNVLASGSADRTVILWDADAGKALHTLEGHKGDVRSLVFSFDGRFVFSAGADRTVRIWATDSGKMVEGFLGHLGSIEVIDYITMDTEGGVLPGLITGGLDHLMRVWTFDGESSFVPRGEAFAPGHAITSQARQRGMLFTGGWDGTVKSWEVAIVPKKEDEPSAIQLRERFTFHGHTAPVRAVAISPDLSVLASAGHDNTVRLWRTAKEKRPIAKAKQAE